MNERLPWFPCYPTKLLGALSAMKPTEGYVYWIVCLRIYEVRGPCLDSLDAISRRTGYTKRVVSDALDRLFRSGKLLRDGNGITNPFAEEVLASTEASREKLIHAGRAGGIRSAQIRKKNQSEAPSDATASVQQASTKLRPTERKKEDTGANAPAPSGAPELPLESLMPPEPKYADAKHELWGEGPVILRSLGMPETRARQMIGRWMKEARDDARGVLGIIQRARDNGVQEPVSWISRAIRTLGNSNEPSSQDRNYSVAGATPNGADAVLAGMGRLASKIGGANPPSRSGHGPSR